MAADPSEKSSFSPSRKWGAGLHLILLSLVVFAVMVMINYLSRSHFTRFHLASASKVQLSPMTRKFLDSLTNHVRAVIYYNTEDPLYSTVEGLLREYHYANGNITFETVDYLRDAGTAQKIKAQYQLAAATDKNVVIFDCNGRSLPMPGDTLARYTLEQIPDEKDLHFRRKAVEFEGEQMFTSALLSVTSPIALKACVLQGYGQHSFDSDDPNYGYQAFQTLLQQNYLRTEAVSLLATNTVLTNCNLLIVAGPREKIAEVELEKISQYLSQGGRLLVLFNAYTTRLETGLEKVLADWGVRVGHNEVVDPDNSVSAAATDVIVQQFSKHPIVYPLMINAYLDLKQPRAVGRLDSRPQAADAPRVEELAFTGPRAFSLGARQTNRFPLAVAVEKGAIKEVVTQHGTTRIVVVGDSIFLANGPINSVANRDFGWSVVNWLLGRAELMGEIGPRRITEYHLAMTRRQLQQAQWVLLAGLPGAVLLVGGVVWLRRRK